MRIPCPKCNNKMTVTSRKNTMSEKERKTTGIDVFRVYLVCTSCGSSAKSNIDTKINNYVEQAVPA